MKYWQHSIVFQEMPSDIALSFELTNCPFKCAECHSPHLQQDVGEILTLKLFKEVLGKYCGLITAVLFLGSAYNEIDKKDLHEMLDYAKIMNLKTCIWTGEDDVCQSIRQKLDFLKVGQYIPSLGGLDKPTTNQKYINVKTNESVVLRRNI